MARKKQSMDFDFTEKKPEAGSVGDQLSVIRLTVIVILVLTFFTVATNVLILSKLGSGGPAMAKQETFPIQNPGQPSAPTQAAPTAQVSTDDDPVMGSASAKVTIIEFSDFQCPFCSRFHTDAFKQIKTNYIDTGKVKFVYRDFPLSIHPQAQKSAEASECADEQGKYWEYYEVLFANQGTLSVDNYKAWAKQLGLDSAKFDSCLDSGKYASEVQADFAAGQAAGVSGTPTFFVNGVKLVGAQPYSAFQSAIDQALAAN